MSDEDSMPSKMVPAQQLSDAGEDLVRLAAAKDAEITTLTAKLQDERQHHARQYLDSHAAAFNARWWMAERFEKWAANPEAWTPDDDVHMEFRFLRHIAEKLAREIAALTEQRDASLDTARGIEADFVGWREEHKGQIEGFQRQVYVLTEQRDQANKTLIAVSEMLYQRPDMVAAIRSLLEPAEHAVFDEAAAALHVALDAEAAAETAPSLPETP